MLPGILLYTPPKTDPVLSHSCQCQEYISAEELCDAQCLARATRLSLAWGPSRKLILSMKDEAGSIQRVSPVKGRIRKNLQVPHTARHVVCHPVHNSRGKLSSLPQTRRFLTLLSQLCRDPAVGVRNAEEA